MPDLPVLYRWKLFANRSQDAQPSPDANAATFSASWVYIVSRVA